MSTIGSISLILLIIAVAMVFYAIYLYRYEVLPTLKKYNRDSKNYMDAKNQYKQLVEYIEICNENELPKHNWLYLKYFGRIIFVLSVLWIFLQYLNSRQ